MNYVFRISISTSTIEKKVKGKILRTYETLLESRANPRYLQKYGYIDVE
jgi:hypothetical protein